jgi:hypothetical protein
MTDFSKYANVVLGKLCPSGHDHQDGKSYRHIRNYTCCECQKARIKAWQQSEAGRKAATESKARHKGNVTASAKAYRAKARDKRIAYNLEYRSKNKAWLLAYYRDYNNAKRKVIKTATPAWADLKAIKEIYAKAVTISLATGVMHHVDHVVPLISDRVCGLHTEANLEILSMEENCRKGNRWWPEDGGLNGYADRLARWEDAKQALA